MANNTDVLLDFISLAEEPICYLSSDFVILEVNDLIEKIFKIKKESLVGKSFTVLCPAYDSKTTEYPFDDNVMSHIGKKTVSWHSLSLKNSKNGIKFLVIGTVKTNKNTPSVQNTLINNINDPTYEEIASQLLTEQLDDTSNNTLEHVKNIYRYLENIIAQIPASVYWMNKDYVYLGCSNSMAKLLNLESRHDMVGKTYADLFDEKSSRHYKKADKTVMDEGISISVEEPLYYPDGTKKIYLSNKVPLYNLEGKIIGMLGLSVDITDRKKMEADLKKAKELADTANQAKDEFLANMSHDIRTPLTGIIGISAMLEQEVQKIEEKEHAHWVNVSGEQLLTLLNSVLDIVSIGDKQENQIKKESVNINQLLHNIAELELPTIKLKHLELTVDVDDTVPEFINTDEVKLHRVLLNLLGNAIKFTAKGHVGVKVYYTSITDKKGQLDLFVSDTGPGISKDDQSKVFDRFFRSNPSYKGQYTGFGVGLHIVQEYVAMLKGTISLESQVGIGTTFKVSIPVEISENLQQKMPKTIPVHRAYNFVNEKSPTPAVTDERANSVQKSGNSPVILLVEDNPIALKVVESVARGAHCTYLSATTGEQALMLAKENEFDLILSDIGLPGISGNELTSAIRTLEKRLNKTPIPIIGLTAHAANVAEQESLQAGMNKVISKPITLATLQTILSDFVLPKPDIKTPEPNLLVQDLPDSDAELFAITQYLLLDVDAGVSTLGTIETLKELVTQMLREDLPRDMEAIKKAHLADNWEAIEQLAHKIKSGALYCGMVRMKYACQYLERYQKAGHSHLQNELYQQLISVVEQTQNAISEWLARAP